MKIVCPGCSAEYNVDDTRIPAEGMKATCPRCMSSWVVGGTTGTAAAPPAAGADSSMDAMMSMPDVAAPAPRAAAPSPAPRPAPRSFEVDPGDEPSADEVREITIFGRSIPLPDFSLPPGLVSPKMLGVLVVVLLIGIYGLVKLSRLNGDLKEKSASWGQVDFAAIRAADLWDANLPLKDDIAISGSYQDNFTQGLVAFNLDTYAGFLEALSAFRKAARIEKKSALSTALAGECYARLREYDPVDGVLLQKANVRVDRALRLGKDLAEAYRAKAELELSRKDVAKAREAVAKAIELKGSEAQNYITQGRIELSQGGTEAAQKAFQKAVELNKDLPAAHYNLGFVLERSADYPAAEQFLKKALVLSPGHPKATIALAQLKLERFNLINDALDLLSEFLEKHKSKASAQEVALAEYLLARAHDQSGDTQKALAIITEARQSDPQSTRLLIYEADLKAALDPSFQAEAYIDEKVRPEMQDADYFFYKAKRLSSRGSYGEAIEMLNKVIAKDPGSAKALYDLGVNYQLNGEIDKALESYQKAIRADRGFGDAYVHLATLQIGKRNYDDAMKLLEEVNGRNDRIASVHNLMGVIQLKKGDLVHAKEEFARALEIDPRFAEAHRNMADYLLAEKKFAEAEKEAQIAQSLDPNSRENALLLGRVYEGLGRYAEAIAAYERILVKEPKNVMAWMSLGRAAAGKKDYAKAQEALVHAVELDESNPMAHLLLGDTYFQREKYDEAIQSFGSAQRLDPKNPEIYVKLGETNLKLNKMSEAITILKECLSLNPNNYAANGLIGQAYLKMNARQEAMPYLEKQLKLAPDNAARADIYFTLGEALRQDAPDEAMQNYQKALQFNKKNARALYGMGQIYEENNNVPAALKAFTLATAADKNLALPHRHLGYIYSNQNRKALALKEFQTYLRLDPAAKDRDEIHEQMSFLH